MIERDTVLEIDAEREYGVSEIARITGVHSNTIRKDLKEGNLKGRQGAITRWWKAKGSDVLEWWHKR